jgi:ADP-heptose:LPS heptosyltransferase
VEPADGLGKDWTVGFDAGSGPISLSGRIYPISKILGLRGGALGDLILTLPVLREIRKAFSDAEIELLGVLPQARLAMPEYVDRVERVDSIEFAPLFAANELPEALRDRLSRFDLAVNFFADPDSVITRNLIAAGIRTVVGGPKQPSTETHVVHHLASVLEPLGLALRDPVPALAIEPSPGYSSRLAFHPGSGSAQKNWPVDRWTELIQRCEGRFNEFLLIGGEADEAVVEEFIACYQSPRVTTLLNTDLAELSLALSACTVFVGHDTGISHLAAAVGVPTVALFGPTNPDVWAPLGIHVRVIRAPAGTMDSIPVDDVVAAVTIAATTTTSTR